MSEQLLTCAEAAEILGMSDSGTYKLISKGVLTRRHNGRRDRGRTGIVASTQVEQVAADRARVGAEARQQREEAPPPVSRRPPDAEQEWMTTREVAELMGVTTQAIAQRCRKGTIPAVRGATTWWIRAAHARIAANVRATDGPEAVAIALDGIL